MSPQKGAGWGIAQTSRNVRLMSTLMPWNRGLTRRSLLAGGAGLMALSTLGACAAPGSGGAASGTSESGASASGASTRGLRVAEDGRHLLTGSGEPLFVVADTGWALMSGVSVEDAKTYVRMRRDQGFNTVMANLLPFSRVEETIRGVPFEGAGDLTRPREEWFAGCDEIIEYARSIDMYLGLGLLWSTNNGGRVGGTAPTDEELTVYGTFIGERYHSVDNAWFYVGGDDDPVASAPPADVLGRALKTARPDAVVTFHTWNKAPAAMEWDWLDFYAYQWNSNSSPFPYEDVRETLDYEPRRPAFSMEPPYDPSTCCGDDRNTTPQKNRRSGWWAALSGALGVAYGGPRTTWNMGEDTGSLVVEDIERPQARQTALIGQLLSEYRWPLLVPDWDADVLVGDRGDHGSDDFAMAAAASDGSVVIAYTPVARDLTVDLTSVGGRGSGRWFDPASGDAVGSPQPGEGTTTFTNPLSEDAVLVVEPG